MLFPRLTAILLACVFAASDSHAATPLPCEFQAGLIWLKVSVEGRTEPLSLVLDSGAGRSVLEVATARKLGVTLGRSRLVQGADGPTTGFEVTGFVGTVAGVPLSPTPLALNLSAVSRACGLHIDGLVGLDFFRAHVVRIDYARQRVTLLDRAEWTPREEETLPLVMRSDAMCLRVGVDDKTPGWARVDTGCDTALHWTGRASSKGEASSPSVALVSGQSMTGATSVHLGSRVIPGVKTSWHAAPMFPGESGLIGNALLSRFVLTFDVAKGRLGMVAL